ncbi:S-adenosyl-L-methionine-dependent methyltransferase [Chaetomium fimeti]|uniref:S-adenosyl-L-methionine-dependent methyltransferase n=1 Tax=Chaetomium fimeti TaxID=1854472 RepID=A0AAE0LRV0_9PEZI|nr:S-adenosyl-L-methionine-dependent methyltransferase [Chaetomium fimeti]
MATEAPQPKTAVEHFNASAESYEKYTGGCTRELALALLNLPELADAGAPGSVVLDNACGTGIVTEELLLRQPPTTTTTTTTTSPTSPSATIHAVDAAPNMVTLAQHKLSTLPPQPNHTITTHTMPGEHLAFPDHTFTHSITNLGILFFASGPAGAAEIYRTLRPGGIAVVSTWTDLGYIGPVVQAAQRIVRPGEEVYKLPVAGEWLEGGYLRRVMAGGGFGEAGVEMVEMVGGVDGGLYSMLDS